MFGRAIITLGIGPHSSCVMFCFFSQEIGQENVSEMTCFVSSETYNLNSVNQSALIPCHE